MKENNFEYVDLGLPSGTKWAKCNVGAEHEEDAKMQGFIFYSETQKDFQEEKKKHPYYCIL